MKEKSKHLKPDFCMKEIADLTKVVYVGLQERPEDEMLILFNDRYGLTHALPISKFTLENVKKKIESVCLICGNKIIGFKDKLSYQEFQITGMCQKCQDEIFNKKYDE